MLISVQEQLTVFGLSILLGCGLGVLYDVFRLLRLLVRFGPAAIFLQDLLFWLAAALLTFFYIFAANSGQIRWFILFGALLGAVIYHLTLGEMVIRFLRAAIDLIRRVLTRFIHFVLFPFVVISRGMRPHTRLFGRRMKKIMKNSGNLFKNSAKQYTINKQEPPRRRIPPREP